MANENRNCPAYGLLEGYANNELKTNPQNTLVRQWVNEIRKESPEAWNAAVKDFEIYRDW